MTNQLEYKVRYSTPAQPYNIHRDTVGADSLEQVRKMFDGLRVIEIDLVIDPEYTEALLAAFDADAAPVVETRAAETKAARSERELVIQPLRRDIAKLEKVIENHYGTQDQMNVYIARLDGWRARLEQAQARYERLSGVTT